jgi:RNA polymerase sporulation-specific sigma factor
VTAMAAVLRLPSAMTDVELANAVRDGSQAAFREFIRRCESAISFHVNAHFAAGLDAEDLRQTALLAAHQAVLIWQPERSSLIVFASILMKRRLASAVKSALRGKHGPLNDSLRFETPVDGDEVDRPALTDATADPLQVVLAREELGRLLDIFGRCTAIERHALAGIVSGIPYSDLGPRKVIDNAVQRARRKIGAAA